MRNFFLCFSSDKACNQNLQRRSICLQRHSLEPHQGSCPFPYWKVNPGKLSNLFICFVTLYIESICYLIQECFRWYALLGVFDEAIKHMLEVLACGHQSKVTQELFLKDFFQIIQVAKAKWFPFFLILCLLFYLLFVYLPGLLGALFLFPPASL